MIWIKIRSSLRYNTYPKVTTSVDDTHVISRPIIRTRTLKGDRFGLTGLLAKFSVLVDERV